jgi:endo-1,4-beta-xylanase
LARKYLPNTKLLINDFGIINDNNATTTYLTIINLLKDRGLIDGIGVQGHRFELERTSTTTLTNNLDRLYQTGLPIYMSEVDLGNLDDTGTPDDNTQLQLYQSIFPVLWQHPGVKGITLWGYVEAEMWQPTCYLVLKNGTWRPALTWIAQYVKDHTAPTGIEKITNSLSSSVGLEQNYPNPFSNTTKITFTIATSANVSLKIYNSLGMMVASLVNEYLNAGTYIVKWDAKNAVEGGIYYYTFEAENNIITKKMLLIK